MMPEFATGRVRFVEHMTFLEVFSFLGEGIGGCLYLLGLATGNEAAKLIGILFVGLAVVALLAHLGPRAMIAWRALARIGTSWVSRGTLFIGLFMAFAIGGCGARLIQALEPVAPVVEFAAALCAVLVVFYAGMMLRSMKAVVLWRSLYLPASFSCHSLASALVVLACVAAAGDQGGPRQGWLDPAMVASLAASVAVSLLYLASRPRTAAINASLERLFAGRFRLRLLWGALGLGVLLPLACLGMILATGAPAGGPVPTLVLALAALSRLYGDYAFRSAVVMSGAYEPIIPPPSRKL